MLTPTYQTFGDVMPPFVIYCCGATWYSVYDITNDLVHLIPRPRVITELNMVVEGDAGVVLFNPFVGICCCVCYLCRQRYTRCY